MSYQGGSDGDYISGSFSSPIYDYPITVVMWVKKTAAQWAGTTANYALTFYDGTNPTNDKNSIRLIGNNSQADSFEAQSVDNTPAYNGDRFVFSDGSYDDIWVCVGGVFTSDTLREAFVEGIGNGGATQSRSLTNLLDGLKIGGDGKAETDTWNGLLAEVAIFNVALSDSQMLEFQTSAETGPNPSTVDPTNCIGYWPLSVSQATHADQSGNGGPTLTVQSGMPYSSDHPNISNPVSETVTQSLVNLSGVAQSTLSSVSWAWFDQDIAVLNAPTDKGSTETTDSSGEIIISLSNTTLTTGQTGTLILYDSTGSKIGAYRVPID